MMCCGNFTCTWKLTLLLKVIVWILVVYTFLFCRCHLDFHHSFAWGRHLEFQFLMLVECRRECMFSWMWDQGWVFGCRLAWKVCNCIFTVCLSFCRIHTYISKFLTRITVKQSSNQSYIASKTVVFLSAVCEIATAILNKRCNCFLECELGIHMWLRMNT